MTYFSIGEIELRRGEQVPGEVMEEKFTGFSTKYFTIEESTNDVKNLTIS